MTEFKTIKHETIENLELKIISDDESENEIDTSIVEAIALRICQLLGVKLLVEAAWFEELEAWNMRFGWKDGDGNRKRYGFTFEKFVTEQLYTNPVDTFSERIYQGI